MVGRGAVGGIVVAGGGASEGGGFLERGSEDLGGEGGEEGSLGGRT
jgi:hypothetical protein